MYFEYLMDILRCLATVAYTVAGALIACIGRYLPPVPLQYKNDFKISTTYGQQMARGIFIRSYYCYGNLSWQENDNIVFTNDQADF